MNQEPTFPQSIGCCIYCGDTQPVLSDEHVIPYALAGEWILREASCAQHRELTSAFEGEVQHHALGPARAVLGFRSRRKRSRPSSWAFKYRRDGRDQVRDVATDRHPGTLVLPRFSPPGSWPASTVVPDAPVVGLGAAFDRSRMRALSHELGATHLTHRYPDPLAFARFLGKIGYAFSVACLGYENIYDSPLLPAILAGDRTIFDYVGNDEALPPETETDCVHDVQLRVTSAGSTVHIRLLAWLGTPEYIVRLAG